MIRNTVYVACLHFPKICIQIKSKKLPHIFDVSLRYLMGLVLEENYLLVTNTDKLHFKLHTRQSFKRYTVENRPDFTFEQGIHTVENLKIRFSTVAWDCSRIFKTLLLIRVLNMNICKMALYVGCTTYSGECVSVGFWQVLSTPLPKAYQNTYTYLKRQYTSYTQSVNYMRPV